VTGLDVIPLVSFCILDIENLFLGNPHSYLDLLWRIDW